MAFIEQRAAHRVSCDVPIRIHGCGPETEARIHDVSRTGMRLSVPLHPSESDGSEDLLTLVSLVEHRMSSWFSADLNHVVLGSLIRKRVRVARLGERSARHRRLELGCEFGTPLTDAECGILGLDLAPLGGAEPLTVRVGHRPRRYTAHLCPARGRLGRRLEGTSGGVLEGTALFCANGAVELGVAEGDVLGIARALSHTLGSRPVLQLSQGDQLVWSGEVGIRQVESASPPSREMRVHLEVATEFCPRADEWPGQATRSTGTQGAPGAIPRTS